MKVNSSGKVCEGCPRVARLGDRVKHPAWGLVGNPAKCGFAPGMAISTACES